MGLNAGILLPKGLLVGAAGVGEVEVAEAAAADDRAIEVLAIRCD